LGTSFVLVEQGELEGVSNYFRDSFKKEENGRDSNMMKGLVKVTGSGPESW
jgi:hypothetical protein